MNNKELNAQIKELAISKGMCKRGQGKWNDNWDVKEMLEYCLSDMDFMIYRRFPSKEILLSYASEDLRHDLGFYCDEETDLTIGSKTVIFLGDCNINLTILGKSEVYAFDHSKINIICKEGSEVMIHYLDEANLKITAETGSSVSLKKQSSESNWKITGNVKIVK